MLILPNLEIKVTSGVTKLSTNKHFTNRFPLWYEHMEPTHICP